MKNVNLEDALRDVYQVDLFSVCESIRAVIEECQESLKDEYGVELTSKVCETVERFVNDELDFNLMRHEAPWFSEGIRAELAEKGHAVTIKDVLREAFENSDVGDLIRKYGPERAINALEIQWGRDSGYFLQYNPKDIFACWAELGFMDPRDTAEEVLIKMLSRGFDRAQEWCQTVNLNVSPHLITPEVIAQNPYHMTQDEWETFAEFMRWADELLADTKYVTNDLVKLERGNLECKMSILHKYCGFFS